MINLYQAVKSHPGYFKQISCNELLFTQYDCPQVEKKERFFIECNYIAYVISGKRTFHKNNKSWVLDEGRCVFVKKGTHIAEKDDGEGWCVMVFFIPDSFLKQFMNDNAKSLVLKDRAFVQTDHVLPLSVNDLSQSFFVSMISYFNETNQLPKNLIELKFKELLSSLLFDDKNKLFLIYLNQLANDKLQSIEEVMNNNFTFNLSLAQYADLACKSLPTFKRDFKKIFNDTPAKWVLKKRIALAAELMQKPGLNISNIAYECGFENQTHFSRVFKAIMGVSPFQFRQNKH